MMTTWECFAGREDQFAIRFALRPDPYPTGAEPELSTSWGSFEIWVNGRNLCAHVDQGETLERVHWYLLPLVEWLVENWDPALHEERLPIRISGTSAAESLRQTAVASGGASAAEADAWEDDWFDWWQRHSLRAARTGGPFPNVTARRWRDRIEFSWDDVPLAGDAGLSFLAGVGTARLDPVDVAEPLLDAVTAIAEEFVRRAPSQRFQTLLNRIQAIELPERQSERLGWMVGLRSVAQSIQDSWREIEKAFAGVAEPVRVAALGSSASSGVIVGSCQATLLFGAVAPDISSADVQRLAGLLIEQYDPGSEVEELVALTRPSPVSPDAPAWQDGYLRAEEARDSLGFGPEEPVDMLELFKRLAIDSRHDELDDGNIRGVAIASPEHRPTVVINDRSPFSQSDKARRFTLAHELSHLLYDRGHGQRLAVASGPWAPPEVEQRANAFAAYFLMPPDGIRSYAAKLTQPIQSRKAIEEVAAHFRVSYVAMVEHLYNIGLLSDAQREELRDQI
jgi:hypothetical protein